MKTKLGFIPAFILSTVVWALLPASAGAQVAVDSVTASPTLNEYTAATATSGSWSHTVSGSNTYLLVGLASWNGDVSPADPFTNITLAYNGVAMTFLGDSFNGDSVALWGLANPTSGTHNVTWNNSGAALEELGGGSISFTGVGSVGSYVPQNVFGGGSNGNPGNNFNLTLGAGDMGVDILYANNAHTQSAGQTTQLDNLFITPGPTWGDNAWAAMSTNNNGGVAGTVTFGWTDGDGHGGIALVAAVPEPSSLALFGLGTLSLLALRRVARNFKG
ncbi:MAG: PEP-CTERM sorting domain-containing protein [Methylacidiphilales bacterium]|nr:PEP-CTERM sorting domain-containing protein [Candidatus Methylacidiphilales bacterium]